MMLESPTQEISPSSYIVVISGTHVTGKDTIAASLSTLLDSPYFKGEYHQHSAWSIASSREKRGYDRSTVFGRTWFMKMKRLGLLSDEANSIGMLENRCVAVVTCFALRKQGRDAIRDVMLARSIRVIFVVLQIARETLMGRTVGAENPELAMKILEEKAEDIRMPLEEEKDVLVVDATQDVDSLTVEIKEMIKQQVGDRITDAGRSSSQRFHV